MPQIKQYFTNFISVIDEGNIQCYDGRKVTGYFTGYANYFIPKELFRNNL